jgi:uncharacterized protein (DUF2236 family)
MAAAEGIYDDDAIIRRLYREHVMVLAGPRALLMQAAHPVAWAGFYAQTTSKDEPYERLHRTAQIVELVTYGSRREAERATRRVRAMHKKVRGELFEDAGPFPAGTPYAADNPELLLWILATLVDSGMTVYQRYVRELTPGERESLWQDYRIFGRLFGLPDAAMPASYGDFRRYMRRMLDGEDLYVTDEARTTAREIVMRPPVPLAARPLVELANFVTVGLLPPRIRREYGFSWDPARGLFLLGHTEYARRVLVPLLPGRLRYNARRHLSAPPAAAA